MKGIQHLDLPLIRNFLVEVIQNPLLCFADIGTCLACLCARLARFFSCGRKQHLALVYDVMRPLAFAQFSV